MHCQADFGLDHYKVGWPSSIIWAKAFRDTGNVRLWRDANVLSKRFILISKEKKKPNNHFCEKQDLNKIYIQFVITVFWGRSLQSSWHLFIEITNRYHKENGTKKFYIYIAAWCDFNNMCFSLNLKWPELSIRHLNFLFQLSSVATATSLTSRTETSQPLTRCTGLELWFSSLVTPGTLSNKAPLLLSASVQGIHTGMTRSLYAKVTLRAGRKQCSGVFLYFYLKPFSFFSVR